MSIEEKIQGWKRSLHGHTHLEDGTIEELESHLRDAIEFHMAEGANEDDAFNIAIERMGPINTINQQEKIVRFPEHSSWTLALIKNFIKVNGRQFIKNRSYHITNITGLSVAFTCLLFISLFLFDELTFERLHPDSERIYRLSYSFKGEDGSVEDRAYSSGSWPSLVAQNIPAVEEYFRFIQISHGYITNHTDDKSIYTEEVYWSDSNALTFLNFPLKIGRPEDQLRDLSSLVLTETTSKLFFGDENPIGKTMEFAYRDRRIPLKITGVIYDPPSNTHFQPKYLASIHALDDLYGERNRGWITKRVKPGWAYSYIKINDPTAIPLVESRLKEIWNEAIPDRSENLTPLISALNEIHFNPPIKWEIDSPIQMSYIYGLIIIGIFILIIAMTNYLNLTTAQATQRRKEVGIRQTLGSTRNQLRLQFFMESMFTIILSVIISLLLVYVLLPEFNFMIDKNLSFEKLFFETYFPVGLAGATALIALLAGIYPSLYFTTGSSTTSLAGTIEKDTRTVSTLRSSLIVVQFTVAIVLIISTITVNNQLDLINNGGLSKNREAIIGVRTTNMGNQLQIQRYKNEIESMPNVINSTLGMHLPRQSDYGRIDTRFSLPELNNDKKYWNKFDADGGFAKTFDLEFIAGSDFSYNIDSSVFIVNEAAVKSMGISPHEAIGMKIKEDSINYVYGNATGIIIGVVKDFAYESVRDKINPLVISANTRAGGALSIKLGHGIKTSTIESLEDRWSEIFPGKPFEYWFLDSGFERLYHQERRLGRLIPLFSGLAIFIAMLGLFALVNYMTELRKKEIGIRKVLGASITNITRLLVSQFMKMVVLALILGIPLAWIGMNSWLEGFNYRVSVNTHVVGLSGMIIIVLSMMTIGYKSIKAASSNPVDSLKYE